MLPSRHSLGKVDRRHLQARRRGLVGHRPQAHRQLQQQKVMNSEGHEQISGHRGRRQALQVAPGACQAPTAPAAHLLLPRLRETLEEINGEIREAFEHAGGEVFTYIPCLNDDAAHISALVAVIEDNLSGWLRR